MKPIIGITIGDAAGIGPEITLKALALSDIEAKFILIGDAAHLKAKAAELDISPVLEKAEIHDLKNLPAEFEIGVDADVTGRASAENIEAAVELWRAGVVD